MTSKLDRLLDRIDPSRTLDKDAAEVDQAVNTFYRRRSAVRNRDGFEAHCAEFFGYIEKSVFRLGPGEYLNRDLYWRRCTDVFNKVFGPNGDRVAFDMATTGKQGGLYQILKILAEHIAEFYSNNQIAFQVNEFWNSLTTNEKLSVSDEYIEKYGHLLPSEFTGINAVRIKMNFFEVLKIHPKLIQSLRRVGR